MIRVVFLLIPCFLGISLAAATADPFPVPQAIFDCRVRKNALFVRGGDLLVGGRKTNSNGSSVVNKNKSPTTATIKATVRTPATDRPARTKRLALWLMVWNSLALVDALMFTFRPSHNLDGYLLGEWGPHTLAMTRMLANCQVVLIAMVTLIAWRGDEKTIKNAFKILIFATLGAFRAIASGVREGTIKAPWKSGYATALSLPPLLILSYFAWIY